MQRSRLGLGVIWALGTLVIAGIAGAIGYGIGAGANVTTDGTVATRIVYGPGVWGFGGLGLLFGLLFLFLIFGLVRRAIWGGYRGYGPGHPGGWGRYGWDGRNVPPGPDAMLQDWHRRAHGNGNPAPGGPGGPGGPTPPSGA